MIWILGKISTLNMTVGQEVTRPIVPVPDVDSSGRAGEISPMEEQPLARPDILRERAFYEARVVGMEEPEIVADLVWSVDPQRSALSGE